jgi:hypothetical protein
MKNLTFQQAGEPDIREESGYFNSTREVKIN